MSNGFNVDTEYPIIVDPKQLDVKGSLFGYSLDLDKQSVFIGAPKHGGGGGLFQCSLDGTLSLTDCTFVLHQDIDRLDAKEKAWLGATVVKTSRRVYTCAPRTKPMGVYRNMTASMGTCYSYDPNVKEASPLFDFDDRRGTAFSAYGWHFLTAMGHSLALTNDDNIVVGAPLARTSGHNWDFERMVGTIVQYDSISNSLKVPMAQNAPWAQTVTATNDDPHAHDLGGSAIAKGTFYTTYGDHFAVGSPKAELFKGRVTLCPDCFAAYSTHKFYTVAVDGSQFGERFGHTICAVDLNHDGYHDLVVGAPLHASTNNDVETGAVYVYQLVINKLNQSSLVLVTDNLKRPEPLVSGSRFGSALANLGDLDGDGFEDFAVGAPYDGEDRNGRVYIYRGSVNYRMDEMPQVIKPVEWASQPFRGFGSSFSKSTPDIDANGFPDFAVGAMDSDKVVVLRSKPVVSIEMRSTKDYPRNAVDPERQGFDIKIIPQLLKQVALDVTIRLEFLNVDPRIQIVGYTPGQQLSLEPATFTVKPINRNFGVDIYDVEYVPPPINFLAHLTWSLTDNYCKEDPSLRCPIIDPRNELDTPETLRFSVTLQTGCKDNADCQCDLELKHSTERKSLPVGTHEGLNVNIKVHNHGNEPAFNGKIQWSVPVDIDILDDSQCKKKTDSSVSSEVNVKDYTVVCNLPPILKQQTKVITLPISVQHENVDSFSELPMSITLDSPCNSSQNWARNFHTVQDIDIIYDFHIDTKIVGEKTLMSYQRKSQKPIKYTHIYRVENKGPSVTNDTVRFKVYVPRSDYSFLRNIEPRDICHQRVKKKGRFDIGAPTNQYSYSLACNTANCLVAECSVSRGWAKETPYDIKVNMEFRTKEAKLERKHDSFAMFSHFETILPDQQGTYLHSVTEFTSGAVDNLSSYWPIFIGAGIVFFILVVVLYALYKTNSFDKMRIYKSKLQHEQQLAGVK